MISLEIITNNFPDLNWKKAPNSTHLSVEFWVEFDENWGQLLTNVYARERFRSRKKSVVKFTQVKTVKQKISVKKTLL